MTPLERRWRIYELAEADEAYQKLKAEYEPGKAWFEKWTDRLPRWLRDRLWAYPGSGYFMHHRMLTLICEQMKFLNE